MTHAAVPLLAGWALRRRRVPVTLMIAGMAAAMLPDLDSIGFRFGVPYGSQFGHRGFSHSLAMSLLIGLAATLGASRLGWRPGLAFAFATASAASHGLLDMITNGGRGVALWWPLSDTRQFAPFRPVEVSPIGLHRALDPAMIDVLASEMLWVVLPALALALLWRSLDRSRHSPDIDLGRGQP